MKSFTDTFCYRFACLVHNSGKSQSEISIESGIPQPTISGIISKKVKSPSLSTAITAARYFGVSLDFLTGSENIISTLESDKKLPSSLGVSKDVIDMFLLDVKSREIFERVSRLEDKDKMKICEIINSVLDIVGGKSVEVFL